MQNQAHFIVNLDFFKVTVASILQQSADVSGQNRDVILICITGNKFQLVKCSSISKRKTGSATQGPLKMWAKHFFNLKKFTTRSS